jgi:hypothetical protein
METEPCKGPRPGDVAVCIGCIGIAEYGPDLRLVKADLSKIDDETRRTLEAAKTAVRLAHRDRAKPFIEG